MNTIQQAKSMANAMRELFEVKGVKLSQSEALEFVAKTQGLKDWNVLSAKLTDAKAMAAHAQFPCFCTKCGSHGTIEEVAEAFVEQGAYDGETYEYEGKAPLYACSACGGQFLDWNVDLDELKEKQTQHVLVAVEVQGRWVCRAYQARHPMHACGYESTTGIAEWLADGVQAHRATLQSVIAAGLISEAVFRLDLGPEVSTFEEALKAGAAEAATRGLQLAKTE